MGVAPAASFDLRLSFTGLCLFVPEDDGATIHVILPDPTACDIMEHRASIFYNSGYAIQDGSLGTSYIELPVSGVINLPDGLPVSGTPNNYLAQALSDASVANVTAISGKCVDRAVLQADCRMVKGVVVMKHARLLSYSAGGPFKFPQTTAGGFLAWKLDWLVPNIGGTELTLELGHAAHGGPTESHLLYPIDGVIELRIKNVMCDESMPEDPPLKLIRDKSSGHFAMYYHLLVGDPPAGAEPIYEHPRPSGDEMTGMLITCTPATGSFPG